MQYTQFYLTENDCYKVGRKMQPQGIVLHDTSAGNPYLKRYVNPDDGKLGKNQYNNHWNKAGGNACVNAFIGKLADGTLACYQTLPWDMQPWGCGGGKHGSYNATHIQWEICDDGYADYDYFIACMDMSAALAAELAKQYQFPVENIVCHKEAYRQGYGSDHSDTLVWMKKFGKDMAWFRGLVQEKLNALLAQEAATATESPAERAEGECEQTPDPQEYIVHAGIFPTREACEACVQKVKVLYPAAYVGNVRGVFIARCELNRNRDYALQNAQELERHGFAYSGILVR